MLINFVKKKFNYCSFYFRTYICCYIETTTKNHLNNSIEFASILLYAARISLQCYITGHNLNSI